MNNNEKKKMIKHSFGMMICCIMPILIISILPLIGVKAARLSSLAVLICPLSMIFMMFGMRKQGNGCCNQNKDENAGMQEKK